MNKKHLVLSGLLMASVVLTQGCAMLVVGAAAGAGAGTVLYLGNELRVVHEVSLERAWSAANQTVAELQFAVLSDKSTKDAVNGILVAKNAKGQTVKIEVMRQSDKLTEIRIRVGFFDTAANRQMAHLVYDRMRPKL